MNDIAPAGLHPVTAVAADPQEKLTLRDPHGLVIDLVALSGDARSGWDGAAGVPIEHAVRGHHSVTLSEAQLEPTQRMLSELSGMRLTAESSDCAAALPTLHLPDDDCGGKP